MFLLGDGARYVTGAEIPVDGGMAAHGGVKALGEVTAPRPDLPAASTNSL
jgi:3alpha(or 20beta)-hydroxysteroid dehydrogenase